MASVLPGVCYIGTFAAEKGGEEIQYGLVHSLKSWDPIYTQVTGKLCINLPAERWHLVKLNISFSHLTVYFIVSNMTIILCQYM